MHIILGGTGHVGSAAARALLAAGEPVTIVAHDRAKADPLEQAGAKVAVADIHDVAALRAIFRTGRRAFLLNPPAPPSTDTDAEEKRSIAAIVAALDGSGLEKLVVESTYGAQPGDRLGDLGTLHELEQGVAQSGIPAIIQRAAYYFSNWDASLETARNAGMVHTLYPADLALPMVAPRDLGAAAARFLAGPVESVGLRYVEGPEHYSSADVAAAFASALRKPVTVQTTPREGWIAAFLEQGFSQAAAESYARMTAVSLDGGFAMPDDPLRGVITLQAYVSDLVADG